MQSDKNNLYLKIQAPITITAKNLQLLLNGTRVDGCISSDSTMVEFSIPLDKSPAKHRLEVRKLMREPADLISISIDDIDLPFFLLNENSNFVFSEQSHAGSRHWEPPGTWVFEFETPILTWILDCKILHESKYNKDYLYPWSYKLGPDSVQELGEQMDEILRRLQS